MRNLSVPARRSRLGPIAWGLLVLLGAACSRRTELAVSPAEISDLGQRVAKEPSNGALVLRYSAALFAAGNCDSASTVARQGATLEPTNAVAPLVLGQCLERAGNWDDAIAGYVRFAADYPKARGAAAVRARELLARRLITSQRAKAALQQEQALAAQVADPQTVAILPLDVSGDSTYRPLSRGLAQIMTSDLALIRRFRLVERIEVGAILTELSLGQGGRVDNATAARVGRLVQAGRLVQGLLTVPSTGPVRLEASVVQSTGEVSDASQVNGRLRDLLKIEKDLIVALAGRLGYTLSEAERRTILENGTQNLTAFLAYSNGLVAEDVGDFARAAAFYSEAIQADPGFQQAQDQYQATTAAPGAQGADPGQVTSVASQTVGAPVSAAVDVVTNAVASAVVEVAPTQSESNAAGATEQTTQQAGTTPTADPPPTVVNQGTQQTVTGTIKILFRLP